ncbi:MAG: ribonuclease P protein component [Candidatus Nealsonbacteria bacterium RIFCSPLOWO2_01_FULL_43_32]|uniref:Ribonuclease P protein component n=1 Tax=Candidatus Nealsonbacteria bacterium RIFCSPLOWO2_01_FULL_43_32 TaxID=1801672 RepID=A0A1G2EFT8_9BACT|nr:MAG: ribonuclease P protein component [Candidatus Nealsonbacteria bacterium RIFCSPLOWO2_01_FULL_43_32]
MLPIQNRLKKKNDFGRIFKKGRGFEDRVLSLRLAKNNLAVSRFAFVVSLKVVRKAFLRNKIRRRLREAVKANLSKIKTGLDVVFFARPGLAVKNSKEITEFVERLLKRAELI